MDKFVVDIDAVLDEFEESENKIQPQITVLPQIKQQTTVVPVAAPSQHSEESPPTTPRLLKVRAPPAPEPETDALVDGPKLNGTSDTAKSLNSIEVKSRESELDEAVETTLPEASESKSLLIQESEPVATTISQPPETTLESKPPETTPESKPAKTTPDSKPAETVAESKPVETVPESKPPETVPESKPAETVAESKPAETPEPKAAPTSDHQQTQKYQAVKPKTPMKTQSASPNCRTASPGVSSEQFDEFLRKKSIENAHLLSAHNSPVLQRYRSSSFGLSAKSTLKGTETPKLPEQSVGLPQGELAQKVSQNRDGTVEQVDDRTKPTEPKSQLQSRGETCTAAHVPSGEAGKAPSNHVHQSSAAESEPQSRCSEQSERAQNAEKNPDQGSNRVSEATIKSDSLAQDAANDSINHGPLKSDASNFYRIVSFDMSAVEVTDDDLNLLEDEVHNGRAPSRRSQDSEASVEPVDPDQVIESEAAENVVNNNSMDAPNRIEDLDNPFDVKASDEVPVPPTEQLGDTGSETQNGSTTTTDDVGKQVAEIEEPSPGSPQPESESCDQDAAVNSDEAERGAVGGESEPVVAPSEVELGKVRPMWIHDEDAPICMNCGQDFTIFRRRHHCRACGKVLCGNCCKDRARLQFMDGELARVCSYCIEILNKVERWSRPDPSNPMEYCSTVSPLAQMSSTAQLPPPTVMVPVGVLKKGGEKSNTSGSGMGGTSGCSKSVMFSDGIRPGGDLTDLDIPSTPPAQRAPQRTLKQLATGRSKAVVPRKYRKYVSVADSLGCLPNVLLSNKFKPYDQPLAAGTLFNLLQDPTLPPVSFELTRHKVQLRVKIVTLDCCLGSRVWSFCSEGLAAFGQEEVAFVLEYHADDELAVPRDVLKLYKILYENACRGAPVIQMDHLLFPGGLLSSNEHAGVLFLRTTLQCTQNILTPLHESSYLVAMLILRSEVPWAKLFPLRLLLRLGAELRYYPCPLVSQRFRKAVYFDGDQHSIMSILADFRNYQYTIQNIPGLVIHVVGKTYTIKAPRNRYDLMMKASTTNENILAIGSNFSPTADSHLVCIQGEDGSFQSQTINIASLPVKVTGASFLVFSGALKSNSGYTAKSSIVEDGILVQIGPHDMAKLKQAIHAMENYRIVCKETKSTTETTDTGEEEYVELLWVENEVTRNESVISVVDGSSMAGIPSCKIFSGTDYSNDKFVVRWTELFFLASKDTELDLPDPNRLIEATARSMCVALLPHAAKLYERDLKKVALRISLDPEQFGYELGAGGERLNGEFLSEVDNALVPIITSLDGSHQPMTIELVFYVLLK